MTPAYDNERPEDCSPQHAPADPPTVPILLPQRRRARRLRTVRRSRTVPPSTVWTCAQDELLGGTGLLASWLLTAVVKIVTGYTQPGQRVLLLAPAPYLGPSPSSSPIGDRHRSRPGPYGGLHEASWTVVRLGRRVQTQTAVAPQDPIGEHHGEALAESGSGPRLRLGGPTDVGVGAPPARGRSEPDTTATVVGPDRYDLIITASGPRPGDWFRPADLADVLNPTGMLSVITHGDRVEGRLIDPAGSFVRAAQGAGLRYLDRIALLRAPVRNGALAAAAPAVQPAVPPARHARVHDDLLIFARKRVSKAAVTGEKTSDE
ncbi:hypothetical protein [Amycolatopsis sp. SID8362]|uniref:hypothetical protein n=1 Tax=Amycolatopsis sp. SID8362 TaxID=2690346 RepID=UPI00136A9570|nr:hypothetical protein [Amycolatopsis sp. SID8362]NBH04539.1 hypothetical protein [Amycolatopsis sp. SID8362]NED41238.1 hypothetical protein [Amycolatopsis sp. SID8362]